VGVIANVIAAAKQAEGLPTQGVNSEMDSPPTSDAIQPGMSQQDQLSSVSKILQDIQSRSAPPQDSGESEIMRALAAKDKAIADLKAQNEHLNASQMSLNEKIEGILASTTSKPQEPAPINIPGLPSNINTMSADEQLAIMRETLVSTQAEVAKQLKERDEQFKKLFGPLASEVGQMKEIKDRNQVLQKYPKFDYEANKKNIDKLRAELPGITALEAATIIGAQTDPRVLLSDEPEAPPVMSTRPSMSAASLQSRNVQTGPDDGEILNTLRHNIRYAQAQGNTTQANSLIEAALKKKLMGK